MKKTLLTACLTLTTTFSAYAHVDTLPTDTKHDCQLFEIFKRKKKEVVVDPNKTQEKFNKITNRVASLYYGTIRERNVSLEVIQNWDSNAVNASARKSNGLRNDVWQLNFMGGLYRQPSITDDAFAFVACHEIGHLIGGAPYINGTKGALSVEGQSDFWASAVCIKRYFQEFPETVYMEEGLPKYTCDIQYYGDENAKNICYRTLLAGKSMATMLAGPEREKPDLESPDYSQLSYTSQRHPDTQCRLDTYAAGALCQLDDTSFAFDDKTAKSKLTTEFLCNERTNGLDRKVEKRPKCWFNEKLNNIYINFDSKVISQKFKTLKGKMIIVNYFNHLPGDYVIRLVPSDKITKESVEILQEEFSVKLPASGHTKEMFFYTFTKKTNAKLKFLIEVSLDGNVISGADEIIEIDAKSLFAF